MLDDLGTTRLPWDDLLVVAQHAPPGGALHRSLDPEAAGWTVDTYLQAALVDVLSVANWQRGGDASATKPRPVWRPHQPPPKEGGRNLTAAALAARRRSQSPTQQGPQP